MAHVVITGGAGFIGSHTADALLARGHDVTALDDLDPDVHGAGNTTPPYLHPNVHLVRGDVRDKAVVDSVVQDADVIFHLAACTGVGQSMYQLRRYAEVNVVGTAVLLEALVGRPRALHRLVVASSRAVYGEGAYRCEGCGVLTPKGRSHSQLHAGAWEPACPRCRGPLTAVATPESAALDPGSIYGVTKLAEEQVCMVTGQAHALPVVALRYFNVFGPRQSLSNPYTGVLTAFVNAVRAGRAPEIYEDGGESRDFVHVSDVVRANLLAMEREEAVGQAVNVGSGERVSLTHVAEVVSQVMGGPPPVVTGKFRVGDVRHCFADLGRARDVLGYEPLVSFTEGVHRLVEETGGDGVDRSALAEAELRGWGLLAEGEL